MDNINILMTGFANGEEFAPYLAKLYELKREGVINNVFIEKNNSWKMEIVNGFDFRIVKCDSPKLKKSAPNYFNDVAKVKSNKKGSCLAETGFPFLKSYIIYNRMDVRLDVELIREYAAAANKDKIWISNYDLLKPFYINDLTYFAPANTFAQLMVYREYKRWNYGVSHIREFINPFLEIPIFENYITEPDGLLASNEWWLLTDKELLSAYYAILKKHFYIFGHRFKWDDVENREDLFFNKSYVYDTEITLDDNARANTKYDKTFYIYDNIDYTEHLDTIR